MPPPLHVRFTGSAAGAEPGDKKPQWRVVSCTAVKGEGLPDAETMTVIEGTDATKSSGASAWTVHGTTSNVRYTTRPELKELAAVQEGLGRPQATQAALIVIKKNEEWWSLAQDERRDIVVRGGHIGHGAFALDYLPAVSRRLHHCRELGGEPFDFLTWFEYAPEHAESFDELVRRLRATEEWGFVEREVEVKLERIG